MYWRPHLFFWLFLFPCVTDAQWRGYQFERFDARDGLNSDFINDICQDTTGFIYLAGYQQLIRYDGHVFEDFTHNPLDSTSIGPGQINALLHSRDDRIWLAMRRAGLNVFDPRSEVFRRYRVPVENDQVNCILEDASGKIWLGGSGFAVICFDPEDDSVTRYVPEQNYVPEGEAATIREIMQDRTNPEILWLTASGYSDPASPSEPAYHIFRFDTRTGQFARQGCFGNVMVQDGAGRLLGGSWLSGLWRYDPVTGDCDNMKFTIEVDPGYTVEGGVFEIQPYKDTYWLGSRSSVVSVDNSLHKTIVLKDKEILDINAMHHDASGNMWVGGTNCLMVMNPSAHHMAYYALAEHGYQGRIYPGRLAFDPLRETIYLINRNEPRLYRIPLDEQRAADYLPMPHRLYGVAVTTRGEVIVAAESSFYTMDQETGTLTPLAGRGNDSIDVKWLWALSNSDQGIVAGPGQQDFYWMDDSTYRLRHLWLPVDHPEATTFARCFLTDDGKAVLSSGHENYIIDLSDGSHRIIKAPDVGHIIRDHQGDYWLGTISHLGRYKLVGDSLQIDRYFTAADGLTNFTATHLHLDQKGRIWIFSNNGVSAIDPVTGETRNAGIPEGLVTNNADPVQVINAGEKIVTVNANGVIVFHPDSLWHGSARPVVDVVIKELRIQGRKSVPLYGVNFIDHLLLKPDENTLDVQFQALSFPSDRKVTYSYRVDGLHANWVNLGKSNSVTLSQLPPGDYSVRIKAAPPEVDAPEKVFSLSIATPVFQRAWFLTLCGCFLVGAIVLAYRLRVRQVRRHEEQKTLTHKQIAELELKALRSQMNPHFMFNSLNSIKNYILRHESAKAAEYLSNFAHLIRLILQNSREKTVSLQDELETLMLYIDLEKLRFRDGFQFTCQVDEEIDAAHVRIPPMIVQPYVENAIWHGLLHKEQDRHLALRISRSNGSVLCEIEDNGIGRQRAHEIRSKSATRYKSMGMGITADRIALMNSMNALGIQVNIHDKLLDTGVAAGTLVRIAIPDAHNSH